MFNLNAVLEIFYHFEHPNFLRKNRPSPTLARSFGALQKTLFCIVKGKAATPSVSGELRHLCAKSHDTYTERKKHLKTFRIPPINLIRPHKHKLLK